MKEMNAPGFDPVFLAISMQYHLAPRVLRRDGHHFLPMATTPSILAGMKESGMYARSCLVPLLKEVHDKVPAVALQDYVEYLAQRVEHEVASVAAEHACDAALLVAKGFEKRVLKVSQRPRWLCRATRRWPR